MPNIASAKKRLRQNVTRNDHNRAARSFVRNRVKALIKTLKDANFTLADEQYRQVCSALDKAASKGLCHRNTAARTKSRLNSMISRAKGENKPSLSRWQIRMNRLAPTSVAENTAEVQAQ